MLIIVEQCFHIMKDGEQSLAHKAKLANHTLLNDDNDQTTPESIGLYYLNNVCLPSVTVLL